MAIPDPVLIQHIAGSNTLGAANPSKIDMWLKNLSLSQDCMIVTIQYTDTGGAITATVTDDLGDTYVQRATVYDGANLQRASMYVAESIKAGVAKITVTYSSPPQGFCSVMVSEFNGIAQSGAFEAGVATSVAGPGVGKSYFSGSMTPVSNGCLIYTVGFQDSGGPPAAINKYIAGSGFTLLSADQEDDSVAQYMIQRTAAALTPGFQQDPGTANHIVISVALRPALAGEAPPFGPPRIVRLNHNNFFTNNGTNTYSLQFPCSGDLLVALWVGANPPTTNVGITSIADSNGNTWVKRASIDDGDTGAGQPEIWAAENAKTSAEMTMTLTLEGQQEQSEMILYDCSFPGATFDAKAGGQTTTGTQSVVADLTTVSITPTKPGGLYFGMTGINRHTISGSVGASYLFDAMVYPEADATRAFDEDNGKAHVFNTTTSTLQFVWTVQHNNGLGGNGVGTWAACAAGFMPPVVSIGKKPTGGQRIEGSYW